jgi:hypothetical protein
VERQKADVAQLAEHVLGKDEVTGSIPVIGSSFARLTASVGMAGWSWTCDGGRAEAQGATAGDRRFQERRAGL